MKKNTMKGSYRDQILTIVKAPVYLGIPTTVDNKVNNCSAIALSNTIACFTDPDTFQKLIHRNGDYQPFGINSYPMTIMSVPTSDDFFHG
ncbi:MAG: hypothetical protein GXO83_04840 [Chlorobi bacterium]|nr:hypothetical protein [Chlorobiota bacterium]